MSNSGAGYENYPAVGTSGPVDEPSDLEPTSSAGGAFPNGPGRRFLLAGAASFATFAFVNVVRGNWSGGAVTAPPPPSAITSPPASSAPSSSTSPSATSVGRNVLHVDDYEVTIPPGWQRGSDVFSLAELVNDYCTVTFRALHGKSAEVTTTVAADVDTYADIERRGPIRTVDGSDRRVARATARASALAFGEPAIVTATLIIKRSSGAGQEVIAVINREVPARILKQVDAMRSEFFKQL